MACGRTRTPEHMVFSGVVAVITIFRCTGLSYFSETDHAGGMRARPWMERR